MTNRKNSFTKIIYDNESVQYGELINSIKWTHSIGNHSDKMLIVSISIQAKNTSSTNIKSVMVDNEYMTYISNSSIMIENEGVFYRTVLYYLPNPPSGLSTISINTIGNCISVFAGAVSLANIYQGIPEAIVTNSINNISSKNITANINTLSENALILATAFSSSGTNIEVQSAEISDLFNSPDKCAINSCIIEAVEPKKYDISWLSSDVGFMGISCIALAPITTNETISIAYDFESSQQTFAISRLEKTLLKLSLCPIKVDIADCSNNEKIIIRVSEDFGIQKEGFQIVRNNESYLIHSSDEAGAMYGLLEFSEKIQMYGLENVEEQTVVPRFSFRAIKHNTPWSSYRYDKSIDQHYETMRDIFYWQSFLDMMVENRYNTLTIWTMHPFPYMIRPTNFPKATPFTDSELEEWKFLFKSIFSMAKQRNIQTYIVNWNIFVSDAFKEHYDNNAMTDSMGYLNNKSYNSPQIEQYTRECVAQMLNEYPNLTGVGFTLGENMGGMSAKERDEWTVRTIVAGAKDVERPVKIIYRVPLSAGKDSGGSTNKDVEIMTRQSIESLESFDGPIETEIKFNWSHGYSSDRLIQTHGGGISDAYWNPLPQNHRINWMVRNEDFFTLRWGQTDFVRKHIENNGQNYVGGYYIGSEGYYPALNYLDIERDTKNKTRFAFQRQWLLYMSWGRLLYDIDTKDVAFEHALEVRYGQGIGKKLLDAYKLAGNFVTFFGSYIYTTWDFTSYAEGFLCPVNPVNNEVHESPFLSIEKLMEYSVLDTNYLSIKDYAEIVAKRSTDMSDKKTTPLELADILEKNSFQSLEMIESITSDNPEIEEEIGDLKAWSFLSQYFANKLRAALSLNLYMITSDENEKKKAVSFIKSAKTNWISLVAVTKDRYRQALLINTGSTFSWAQYLPDVDKDIDTVIATNPQKEI